MRVILMFLFGMMILQPAAAQSSTRVVGHWQGALSVGGTSLRIVFNVEAGEDGALTATLDSPDQGAYGIPVETTTFLDDALTLALPPLGASYRGDLSMDGLRLVGTWSQGGQSFPLALEKLDAAPVMNRPQEPKEPFPYASQDVTIETPTAGVTLAGTLTIPAGDGPHPAVVLVSGSGPQNRNEELFGHKPFLVLADHLTRQGIAVLRYDDRGVDGSTGDYSVATSADLAVDAGAAVDFLAKQPGIDAGKIGIAGHSEGGLIGPMVAGANPRVAFLVMLAGPGLRGDEILNLQTRAILESAGMGEPLIERLLSFNSGLHALMREDLTDEQLKERAGVYFDEQAAGMEPIQRQMLGLTDEARAQVVEQSTSPWMRMFVSYDPAPALAGLQIPILSLIGEKDLQVPAEPNTRAIEAAFAQAGNTRGVAHILPGLNHLFQTATTGAPAEYGQIEETMAPAALEAVSSWIKETVSR